MPASEKITAFRLADAHLKKLAEIAEVMGQPDNAAAVRYAIDFTHREHFGAPTKKPKKSRKTS